MAQHENNVSILSNQNLPLRKLQQSFLQHLLNKPSTIDEAIQNTNEASAQQRLGIYASGYRLRLKEAITTDYDCLHGYLGDEMFNVLMDAYIDNYPSHHTSLRYYSQHIPELLETLAPFSHHPELVEIANIEQTFNNSFDAANCSTVNIDELSKLDVEAWPTLQLKFHSSLHQIKCEYNSFDIWKALSKEKTPPSTITEYTNWVIWRKDLISRYRALSEAETYALKQATEGKNFSELCEGLLNYFDEDETPVKAVSFLQSWINERMVCELI